MIKKYFPVIFVVVKNIVAALKNRRFRMALELASFRFLQPFGRVKNRVNYKKLNGVAPELEDIGVQYLSPLDNNLITQLLTSMIDDLTIPHSIEVIVREMRKENEIVRDYNLPTSYVYKFFSLSELNAIEKALEYKGNLKVNCNLRISVFNQSQTASDDKKYAQEFHRDFDHPAFLKAFCYLNDITVGSGEHQYIEKSHLQFGNAIEGRNRVTLDMIKDDLGTVVVNSQVGDAGTRFLANTIGFHRGTRIINKDGYRVFAMFTFSKGHTRWGNEVEISTFKV